MPKEYTVSIDRQTKRYAIFVDDFTIVQGFYPYTDEADAINKATVWIKVECPTASEPKIVYPRITKMTIR